MRARWVAGMLAVMALAGCASSGGETTTEDFSGVVGGATAETGIIRGIAVDPALVPIPQVNVTLSGKGQFAITDLQGRFGFDGLEPGTYFLQATRLGYSGTQQSVEVVAGDSEPPIVKIGLTADPSSVPYVLPTHFTGFISCSAKTANFVWDAFLCDPTGMAGYAARDLSVASFPVDRQPLHLQSEITWEPTQTLGTELVTIQWACDQDDVGACNSNSGAGYRTCNVRGPAPLTCRTNTTDGGGGGGEGLNATQLGTANKFFFVQMFANCYPCVSNLGVGVATEQKFEVYNHFFYGYVPPSDWTFLGSGKVPPPPK